LVISGEKNPFVFKRALLPVFPFSQLLFVTITEYQQLAGAKIWIRVFFDPGVISQSDARRPTFPSITITYFQKDIVPSPRLPAISKIRCAPSPEAMAL
jgi:hypothetical protein